MSVPSIEIQDKNLLTTTPATHIFVALAVLCFAYLFLVMPMTKKIFPSPVMIKIAEKLKIRKDIVPYLLIILCLIVYCIVIPAIMAHYGAFSLSVSNVDDFLLVKTLSVIVTIFVIYYYMFRYGRQLDSERPKLFGYDTMTLIVTLLLILNIFEAVVEQWTHSDTKSFNGRINMANAFAGFVLIIGLLYQRRHMSINSGVTTFKLESNLSMFFVLAYTFWNFLFRIQLVNNTSVLLFLFVSLLLPLYMAATKTGDWLQVRALTLLLLIILNFGLGPGQINILPWYNDTGYNIETDQQDPIVQLFSNDWMKILLVVLAFLFGIAAFKK